jgi:carboxyl-terminal processing protease
LPVELMAHSRNISAGEIMAYGYQHSAFGFVVGTPTAGAVLGGVLSVMPGDLLLYVCARRLAGLSDRGMAG